MRCVPLPLGEEGGWVDYADLATVKAGWLDPENRSQSSQPRGGTVEQRSRAVAVVDADTRELGDNKGGLRVPSYVERSMLGREG